MGTFEQPTFAYMVPSRDGVVMSEDRFKHGAVFIHKIRPEQIEAFQKHFAMAGVTWTPIFNLFDATNHPWLQPGYGKEEEDGD